MRYFILVGLVAVLSCRAATAPGFTGTCRNAQTVAQTIETIGATNEATPISYDRLGCPFASVDQVTLPVGTYAVEAQLAFSANPNGARGMTLLVNGKTFMSDSQNAVQGHVCTLTHVYATIVSDGSTVVSIRGAQSSGGPLYTLIPNATNLTWVNVTRVD